MSILRWPQDVRVVEDAEDAARKMMQAIEARPWTFTDEDWEKAFGCSRQELQEREKYLQEQYRKTPRRKKAERAVIRRAYAEVHAMLGVPYGLTTIWR